MGRLGLSAVLLGAVVTAAGCRKSQPSAEGPPPPVQAVREERLVSRKSQPSTEGPRPAPNLAGWAPGAALLTELAERKAIPGSPECTIQPPKGYRQQPLQV